MIDRTAMMLARSGRTEVDRTDPVSPPTSGIDVGGARGPRRLLLPSGPAILVQHSAAIAVTADGVVETLTLDGLAHRLKGDGTVEGWQPPLLCHARSIARRLNLPHLHGFDVLELFAFVRPARFCVPTPQGLTDALDRPRPGSPAAAAASLRDCALALLQELATGRTDQQTDPVALAWVMGAGFSRGMSPSSAWPWAPYVLAALGSPHGLEDGALGRRARKAMAVWDRLPQWEDEGPFDPPGSEPVDRAAARRRLAELVTGRVGARKAEPRPQQADYADAATAAFAARDHAGVPHAVLAEAGTGVGKTLAYLAPATLWAETNGAPVWVSTYTRNLQNQVDAELADLYRDCDDDSRPVVVRKGRENYLCLLNLEDSVRLLQTAPQYATALGLVLRWAGATRDGDMQGGDFPGWLVDILGRGRTLALADRRGECIYGACPHYRRCFIERSIRTARRARIVIANHALVMIQAALGGGDEASLPTRYVFDEGHHVFDAADSAFAGRLTGAEAAELRRWLLGTEGRGSRARGLKARIVDLCADDAAAAEMLDAVCLAARALPSEGWLQRVLQADRLPGPIGGPIGPTEAFLALVARQVEARAVGRDSPYGLETEPTPPIDGLLEAAAALDGALSRLMAPLRALRQRLAARLDEDADVLDSDARRRIDAVCRGLNRRGDIGIGGWRAMLASLAKTAANDDAPADPRSGFVDWLAIERQDGRAVDVGLHRRWVDPTVPFAATVGAQAHGMLITSATLVDATGDAVTDWVTAEERTGAVHLPRPPLRVAVPSPYDYGSQTRVFIVTDVRKDDLAQVAAAYRSLFLAAGGGGLGLFTAVSRLRGVHAMIADPLEAAGLPLLAQHVDGMDVSTLVDIFRSEDDACLLGTDAVRDGVDVPGRSLRLIVFDRVPWPRPDILHKARKAAFGGRLHDDRITRQRLRQAFGRLVRRGDDMGVFVLLDPMMPSRLCTAFPAGVEIARVGLAEAVSATAAFLAPK